MEKSDVREMLLIEKCYASANCLISCFEEKSLKLSKRDFPMSRSKEFKKKLEKLQIRDGQINRKTDKKTIIWQLDNQIERERERFGDRPCW